MKAHVIAQSLNECIVMSYYLLPPVNHHQQANLFFYDKCNGRLRVANQKPNTNYIISEQNVWNIEIANLNAYTYTLLNVNISASTQFMDFGNSFVQPLSTCMQSFGQI